MNRFTEFVLYAFMALAWGLLFAWPAEAGGYRYSSGYRTYYPQYQSLTVYYVGAPIRAAAIVEAEKKADPDYQDFMQFKQFRGEFEAFQAWKQSSAVPADALPQQAPQSQLQASCVRCHSGESPKGGLNLSGEISSEVLKSVRKRLQMGEMPPASAPEAKDFTNEKAGQVLLEAIDMLSATLTQPKE